MGESDGELGEGFSVEVARAWESAFFAGELPGTRRVALRSAIVLGRLYSEFVKSLVITTAMVLIAWPFGIHIESGVVAAGPSPPC